MDMNYTLVKKCLIGTLMLLAFYVIILLIFAILSKPKEVSLNFLPVSKSLTLSYNNRKIISKPDTSSGFDYKIIGYRAGSSRASVIVKKNNQSFVVQQGSLLENKYKLVSVNDQYASFEFNGNVYQLSTNLISEN